MTQATIEQLMDEGFRQHQAGNLAPAESIYREVLGREHDHCGALHLLGVVAYQLNHLDAAEELVRRAIDIDPAIARFHGHLGLILAAQNKTPEAVGSYQRAVELQPAAADSQNNLANALKQIGKVHEAIAAYRAAIAVQCNFPEAHNNLGLALIETGNADEALAHLQQATTLRPEYAEAWNNLATAELALGKNAKATGHIHKALDLRADFPEALNNLGNALKLSSRADDAICAFERALELRPDFPEALNNLALILHSQARAAEAIALYRRAITARQAYPEAHYNLSIALRSIGEKKESILESERAIALRPDFFEAMNNLGILQHEQGELAAAIATFERALAIHPNYPEGHSNLANVLRQTGQLKQAVRHYRLAVTLRPDYAEAHNNLGSTLQQSDRPAEAMASYQRALELRPDFAEAHNNIGNLFKDQAELDEAIASYERACALAPRDAAADSNRVYTLYFHPDYNAQAILEEHQRWNQRHGVPLLRLIKPHENDPVPKRRLRIGYVSPDFRDHCQSMFTIPLLSNHDHKVFEVYCYADVARPDAITVRLQGYADNWRSIVGMTDQQVADLIRRDRIDILVDLSLHMAHNRLLVFARKPAPVQVTWLAYPGTSGLKTMDYRLSDPHLDPPGTKGEPGPHDKHYTEQTVRLPESFWCYDPLTSEPRPNALPALKNGFITFGCLNNFCKVNSRTLGLWAQVLTAIPNSRLLVLVPRGAAREHLLETLQENGVSPTRVEFTGRQPRDEYLGLYHHIDIALDTFPYNGHTTTLDALWMGVPVSTIIGRTAVGRGAWSQLSNLGLKQLAARSDKQFVRNTVELAADLNRLGDWRATLRDRLSQSPLMNAPRFAAHVEAAYCAMWSEWTVSRTRGLARPA